MLVAYIDVFIGRQPIFDRKENIYAYELLHRKDETNVFPNMNPEEATLQLLINTFLTVGIDEVVGQTKSFVNFSEKLLSHDIMNQIDPDYVVIEILEDTKVTLSFIQKLKKLRNKGFTLALDDFVMEADNNLYDEVFKLVHIIKIDYLFTPEDERKRMENIIKGYPNLSLLAEKIETEEQYIEARRSGYHLFQGYYFAKPEIVKRSDIPSNQVLHFHLFQMLNKEDVDVDEVSQLIMHDVSLSYKLMRYINSLAFNIPNEINSIRQAIMLMGLTETTKWIRILIMNDLAKGKGKGREKALISNSILRAKTCELVAKHNGKADTDKYFLAGMFSQINVIMQQGWDDILTRLSFTDEINNTLRGVQTDITPYVKMSEAIERLDMEMIELYAIVLNIDMKKLSEISKEAHKWATQFD